MADVDPDEELARQLHREMNGLTRIRRRAAPPLPPGSLLLVWESFEKVQKDASTGLNALRWGTSSGERHNTS